MIKRTAVLGFLLSASLFSHLHADDIPSYTEIPYYIKQLEQATLEDQRVENAKKIHDAVVNANLLDKKTVRAMEPMMDRIMQAMDSKLDRSFLDGKSSYLASAVDYFEKQKMKPIIEIPESDWMEIQSRVGKDYSLSTYPEKVILHQNGQSTVIAVNKGIHEAVISRDAKKVAYYRTVGEKSNQAEIWVVRLDKNKQKKVASVASCYTLLFSIDGGSIFYQERPATPGQESNIYRMSAGGGKGTLIASGTLLQTLVEKGKYKGDLVIYKRTMHHLGVTEQECPYAFETNGKALGRIKNAACK